MGANNRMSANPQVNIGLNNLKYHPSLQVLVESHQQLDLVVMSYD